MKNEKDTDLTATVITLILIPFMFVLSASWFGFVLSKLWEWFITPTFNIPPLGIFASVGFYYVIAFLTHQLSSYDIDRKSDGLADYWKLTLAGLIRSLIFLGSGWVVQFFL